MALFLLVVMLMLGNADHPAVEAELIHTPVRHKQVDVYLIVSNPNDFGIRVPKYSCAYEVGAFENDKGVSITHLDHVSIDYPEDFVRLEPGSRLLFLVLGELHVDENITKLRVRFSAPLESPDKIPANLTVVAYPDLELKIVRD